MRSFVRWRTEAQAKKAISCLRWKREPVRRLRMLQTPLNLECALRSARDRSGGPLGRQAPARLGLLTIRQDRRPPEFGAADPCGRSADAFRGPQFEPPMQSKLRRLCGNDRPGATALGCNGAQPMSSLAAIPGRRFHSQAAACREVGSPCRGFSSPERDDLVARCPTRQDAPKRCAFDLAGRCRISSDRSSLRLSLIQPF